MRPSHLALIVCLCFAGCGGGCSGASEEADPPESRASQRTEASGGESTPGPVESEPPADPGPAPELRVTADVDAYAGHATARIANLGDETELSGALGLQRRRGEAWSDVDGVALDLRFACDEEPPECVTLAPGAVFIPPAWLGTGGDAQCGCEECSPAEEGTYRFVVRSCNGAHTVAGEPFELKRR